MPLYDLWYCLQEDSWELLLRDTEDLDRRLKDCTLVHAFEADTMDDARQRQQEFLGFDKSSPIRKLPGFVTRRVETGPVQFGDDWPGMHFRGDSAFGLALQIKVVIQAIKNGTTDLADARIAMRYLESVSRAIDNDVFVGGPRIWKEEGGNGELLNQKNVE